MFTIGFTPSAFDDLAWFRKRDQSLIFDEIEQQLTHQPNVETRNRKKLRPNQTAEWELRIDRFRIFYDVNNAAQSVEIKMVGRKTGNQIYVRGKEYKL